MKKMKIFGNTYFLSFAALFGFFLFITFNLVLDNATRMSRGDKAQAGIKMLDEMRTPVLAIENAENLPGDIQENFTFFKQSVQLAEITLDKYRKTIAYNARLQNLTKQLAVIFNEWILLEKQYWEGRIHNEQTQHSQLKETQLAALHQRSIASFFTVLDVLAMGEKPLHYEINDGFLASTLFKTSGALLVAYLFIIIIIFQVIRYHELKNKHQYLEKEVKERTASLESANRELEAFSYSVSHDLRAPLRSIDGFSLALLEDYNEQLDATGKDFLQRLRASSQKMGYLIDDMLLLSRVSRNKLNKQNLDLSAMAEQIFEELQQQYPDRNVKMNIAKNLTAYGDKALIKIALTNLFSNAWKYTANEEEAFIEFNKQTQDENGLFYIKDNGTGFDMRYAGKLFCAFQRLHGSEFEGTGIGLATVKRILNRHSGDIRAEAKLNEGSCFYFNL